ncbi:MAG: MmgE/PrpD family protein [Dehalococcoidia bacterium]|nr:MmgE/PrpD family protein [Dehalococcoidia bacterium]
MPTATLANFVANTRYGDIPAGVIETAKNYFLDWLGSAYAGSGSKPASIMSDLVEELGGKPEATVIGSERRNTCLHAALVNGAASHVVEMDDLHKASIYHPAAPVMPAALAVAEREGKDGREFLRAVVLAYEASCRIGEAINPSHYRFWHTTGTVGTFGAAVAAGVLLDLKVEEMIWALGSAGTQASGLWEFLADGAMSKQLHPGKAALNGVLGSLLAKRGFTAARRILEGEKGFCRATSEQVDLTKITAGLGESYRICDVSFKPHASCRHTHSAIDATLEIVNKFNLKAKEIEKVTVRVYSGAMDLLGNVEATSPFAAKFNMPYCVSSAVLFRKVGLEQFSDERLWDASLRQLMSKIEMVVDPALDRDYPAKWPAVVQIDTMGGKILAANVDYPKGDPENPLSRQELCDKFTGMATPIIGQARTESLLNRVWGLDRLPNMTAFFE